MYFSGSLGLVLFTHCIKTLFLQGEISSRTLSLVAHHYFKRLVKRRGLFFPNVSFPASGKHCGLASTYCQAECLGAQPLLVILVPQTLGILFLFPPGPAAGYLHVMMTLMSSQKEIFGSEVKQMFCAQTHKWLLVLVNYPYSKVTIKSDNN